MAISIGDEVGRYRIEARISAGGMATLYLASASGASGFSRYVAVKIVHEHLLSDQSFVEMFVDEAILCSKIHHPNVVHVEELGTHDEQHFLAMEYVHGCSLQQLLRALLTKSQSMKPELAVWFAVKVLEGLHAAHELRDESGQLEGVVHRDISPHNILVAYEGHLKVIDFGIAKARGRMQQTTGNVIKGKVAYMSPEQAVGGSVDRRTDIYAVGIVLWEMLTLRRLFKAENEMQLLGMVRFPKVEAPGAHRDGLPETLDDVVLKALALSPEHRFQTAQEFRKALLVAMPQAAVLDSAECGAMLREVVAEQMSKDNARLPQSARQKMAEMETGFLGTDPTVGHSVLEQLDPDDIATRASDFGSDRLIEEAEESLSDIRLSKSRVDEVTLRDEDKALASDRTGNQKGLWLGILLLAIGGTVGLGLGLRGGGESSNEMGQVGSSVEEPAPVDEFGQPDVGVVRAVGVVQDAALPAAENIAAADAEPDVVRERPQRRRGARPSAGAASSRMSSPPPAPGTASPPTTMRSPAAAPATMLPATMLPAAMSPSMRPAGMGLLTDFE